jgi:hypothetical protein
MMIDDSLAWTIEVCIRVNGAMMSYYPSITNRTTEKELFEQLNLPLRRESENIRG